MEDPRLVERGETLHNLAEKITKNRIGKADFARDESKEVVFHILENANDLEAA